MEIKKDIIPLKTKINYGIGSLGLQSTTGLFTAWTLIYYIKIVKINPLLWALAWVIYFAWNLINGPIFGHLSDRTNTKYGRRIPYLMVCGPLLSISFILLYLTPINSEQWVYFLWLILTLIAYDSFFTIVALTFNSLMSELSIEPEERANLSFFAGIGGGIGLAISYALPILFIQNVQPYDQNRPVFLSIVFFIALLGAIFLAFTAFGIKERRELMPEKSQILGLWKSTKTTLKNRGFLTFVIFNFMITFVIAAILSNLPFYIHDVLNASGDNLLASMPLLVYISFSIIGYPLGLLLNKKCGNKQAIIILSSIVVIGLVLLTFADNLIFANICFAIIGFGFSGQTLLIFTLLADVIDKDELETGERREGMFFGTNALITKPAITMSAVISGLVLYLTLYNQDLNPGETQPISAIIGIKLLIGLIPAIFIVIGLLFLWYYPLDPKCEDYKEMKRKVRSLHDEKLKRCREKLACIIDENKDKKN